MANKKMTQKEFKEILASANIDFDVFGWEGILNIIAGNEIRNAKEMENLNLMAGAEARRKSFRTIYNALEERGYFEDK